MGRRPIFGLLILLIAASCAERSPTPPRRPSRPPARVVSINPCIDAILMHVADPGQIAGISHYSQDPQSTSIPLAQAARFTATSGTAEEVVALAPDLVLAGAHVDPATIAALRRLNIALVQLPVPETIADSHDQIRRIAAAVGHADRGVRLNARIDAAVAAARSPAPAVPALIWQGGGLVPGERTLASELLGTTGFRNLSRDYGLRQWDVIPLEILVARAPKVLFSVGGAATSDRMLSHPVLRPLAQHIAVRAYPERLLHCGGPTIIDAVTELAKARRSL